MVTSDFLAAQRLPLGHSPVDDGRGVARRVAALSRLGRLSGGRLLDCGTGSGPYARALAPRFEHVDAIDIEPDRLAGFRQRIAGTADAGRITISAMSAVDLSFPDQCFDSIVAIETLEHVDRLDDVLRELRRVVRPTGTLFVTTPNRWFPLETHGARVRGHRIHWSRTPLLPYIKPLHDRIAQARTFTATSLAGRLERCGWSVCGFSYVMPPFDNWEAGRRYVAPLTDALEHSRLRWLGVSIAMAAVPATTSQRDASRWEVNARLRALRPKR